MLADPGFSGSILDPLTLAMGAEVVVAQVLVEEGVSQSAVVADRLTVRSDAKDSPAPAVPAGPVAQFGPGS